MAAKCTTCEVEITGIERVACRGCSSVFHRSCIDGLNRTAYEAIGKYQQNLYWLCDDCSARFDSWLQANDTFGTSGATPETTKLCEAVEKLNGVVTALSHQLEKREKPPKPKYSTVVGSGSTATPAPSNKRSREDDEYLQGPVRVEAVCGTRKIECAIKTVTDERDQFWIYLGRLDPCHTVNEIAEMAQECLALKEPPKAFRLVKKDADISKLSVVSFRVLVPEEMRETALQAATWPTGVAVRRFDFNQVRVSGFRQ